MANVNVITLDQLESIRSKVQAPVIADKTKRTLELHEKSKLRAAGWPNTLEAHRERKERARVERQAADEAVRQQEGKKEAEIQATNRRMIIEKVNKMLFNETDKAKSFHGAVLMCDVLAERSAQVELKNHVQALTMAREQAFVRQQKEQLELAEEAELQKLREQKQRALDQRDAQMGQLDDLKQKILAEREQNRVEGAMVRAKAAEEAKDMHEKEKMAREQAQRANRETARANDALREFKLKEAERERMADLAIEAYAAKKAALLQERKRREAERDAAKEARRKAMVQLMETKFAEAMSTENARLDRDVQHAESKNAAELAERERLRREEWDAICRSRTQQLDLKQSRRTREKLNDAKFVAAWKERTKELQQEQEDEIRARFEHAAGTCSFQKHQASLKQRKKDKERLLLLQDAAMLEDMQNDADLQFKTYATEFIDEYTQQGKPVVPMQLLLAKPEPFESA